MASLPIRTAPPKPVPKPGQVKVVRALYRYDAQQVDELSFDEGDLLYILDTSDKDWWKASCGNNSGLIPSNYVQESTEAVTNPLHEAAKRGNQDFLMECLRNRISVNGLDKAGSTPLHWACHGGHVNCVKMLLDQSMCEINVQNKLGDTPLHCAAWKGYFEIVELLLEKGARTDVKNTDNKLPSDLANDPQTASLLLLSAGQTRADDEDYCDDSD